MPRIVALVIISRSITRDLSCAEDFIDCESIPFGRVSLKQ